MDSMNLHKESTANGITNHSNLTINNYQPIKGIQVPYQKVEIKNRNFLEKAHEIKRSSDRNNFILLIFFSYSYLYIDKYYLCYLNN